MMTNHTRIKRTYIQDEVTHRAGKSEKLQTVNCQIHKSKSPEATVTPFLKTPAWKQGISKQGILQNPVSEPHRLDYTHF